MSRKTDATLPTYNAIHRELGGLIHDALRQLLEEKHLYQSAEIAIQQVTAYPEYQDLVKRIALGRWTADSSLLDPSGRPLNPGLDLLVFRIPTGLELFCAICDSPKTYNPAAALEVRTYSALVVEQPSNVQDFALAYQCQRCKSACEVFLLRRDKLKLTLCGRAPMEHVQVPSFIPKEIRSWRSTSAGETEDHGSGQEGDRMGAGGTAAPPSSGVPFRPSFAPRKSKPRRRFP